MATYQHPSSLPELLEQAKASKVFDQLLLQLEKDFTLANQPIKIKKKIKPDELVVKIEDKVLELIDQKFGDYLNLLYIVDVSENDIKKIKSIDLPSIAQQITFLILKREWQKVWFRNFL